MRSIEVFADVWCPFAYVGLERLVDRRSTSAHPGVPLWIRAWPLELVNGEPLDPCAVAHKVDALRRHVAPDLFAGFDEATFPSTTLPALDLTAAAYRQDVTLGERVSLALRRALFEEGLAIDDAGVLAAIAEDHGVRPRVEDRWQVLEDWEAGHGRGVLGSPHFFVDGRGFFCPTLLISTRDGVVEVTLDQDRFDQFADRCFGATDPPAQKPPTAVDSFLQVR